MLGSWMVSSRTLGEVVDTRLVLDVASRMDAIPSTNYHNFIANHVWKIVLLKKNISISDICMCRFLLKFQGKIEKKICCVQNFNCNIFAFFKVINTGNVQVRWWQTVNLYYIRKVILISIWWETWCYVSLFLCAKIAWNFFCYYTSWLISYMVHKFISIL